MPQTAFSPCNTHLLCDIILAPKTGDECRYSLASVCLQYVISDPSSAVGVPSKSTRTCLLKQARNFYVSQIVCGHVRPETDTISAPLENANSAKPRPPSTIFISAIKHLSGSTSRKLFKGAKGVRTKMVSPARSHQVDRLSHGRYVSSIESTASNASWIFIRILHLFSFSAS